MPASFWFMLMQGKMFWCWWALANLARCGQVLCLIHYHHAMGKYEHARIFYYRKKKRTFSLSIIGYRRNIGGLSRSPTRSLSNTPASPSAAGSHVQPPCRFASTSPSITRLSAARSCDPSASSGAPNATDRLPHSTAEAPPHARAVSHSHTHARTWRVPSRMSASSR